MRHRVTCAAVTFVACLFAVTAGAATGVEQEFQHSMMSYFEVSEDLIGDLMDAGLTQEDIPVALFIHQQTELSHETIAELRIQGDSWADIAKVRGLGPKDFFVIVVGKFHSETYSPIFAKYKSTPLLNWNKIPLTDAEIVNLVNLRFVSSQHDFSIFKAMALRDDGKDFGSINHEVKLLKAELIREQKKNRSKSS